MGLAYPTRGETGLAAPDGAAGASASADVTMAMVDEVVIDWTAETPGTYTGLGYTDTVTGVSWDEYTSGTSMGTMAITIDATDGLKFAGTPTGANRALGIQAPVADLINAVTTGAVYDPDLDLVEVIVHMEVNVAHAWTNSEIWLYTDAGPLSNAGRWNWNGSQVARVTEPNGATMTRLETGNEFVIGCRITKGRWSWRSDFSSPDPDSAWSDLADHATNGGVVTDSDTANVWDGDPGWNLRLASLGQSGGAVSVKVYKTTIRRYRAAAAADLPVTTTVNGTSLTATTAPGGTSAVTVVDLDGTQIGTVNPSTRAVEVGHLAVLEPVQLSLDPGDYTIANGTDWTIALTGGKMRATYAGSGSPDHGSAGMTACYVTWPTALRASSVGRLRGWLQAMVEYTEATADGIGIGIGFVDDPTTPTDGVFTLSNRVSSGNVRLRINGEITDQTISASTPIDLGLIQGALPLVNNGCSWDSGMYDVSDGTIGNALVGNRGTAISGLGVGDDMYLSVCFIAGGNAGYIEATAIGYINGLCRRLSGV